MYYVKETLMTGGKVIEKGSVVNENVIPAKSKGWLLDQNIIVKVDKKFQEKMLNDLNKTGEEE